MFKKKCYAETYQENDSRAKHDSQVGMQMDTRQLPHRGERYPCNNEDASQTAKDSCQTVNLLGNTAQQEQSQHTTGEDT